MNHGTPTLVILTLVVLAGHGLGSIFSLYQAVPWFDMLMHALGGAWLASVFIVVGTLRYPIFFLKRTLLSFTFSIVILVFMTGIGWEIYEYGFAWWATSHFGNLDFFPTFTDTLSDLLFDVGGAAAVALFLFPKKREVS